MTNLQVPVWGYWIMSVGFAVFLGLLIAYLVKNKGFRRQKEKISMTGQPERCRQELKDP